MPKYTWLQTDEDLTLTFTLPSNTTKADISFHLTAETIEVGIKNGDMLLQGMLHGHVDVEGSAWIIDGRQ